MNTVKKTMIDIISRMSDEKVMKLLSFAKFIESEGENGSLLSGEEAETVDLSENYGKQALDIIKRKNIPNIKLEADENGNAYIDRERYPELYDWAANE